jgi:murein DD-endopeptidase MepM/ murein hydrolase activator NlpD
LNSLKRFIVSLFLIILIQFAWQATPLMAVAQTEEPALPYYIVQEGNTLWEIAALFGVSVEALQTANQLPDPGQLVPGMRLVIPGLEGFDGQVVTHEVAFGETLRSLSRLYTLPQETFIRLNKLVSPNQVYVGAILVVPAEVTSPLRGRTEFVAGATLLELAVLLNENPWTLVLDNDLAGPSEALPGTVLQTRKPMRVDEGAVVSALPAILGTVTLEPLPLSQGKTVVIQVTGLPGFSLRGSLAGWVLNFFPQEEGYVALQGIHTLTEPGLYPLTLEGEMGNGANFSFSQPIMVRASEYIFDPPLTVDPGTIDPAVTEPENQLWASLGAGVTPIKWWEGLFASPVPPELTNCWTSLFGNRRSYNGSAYEYFHGGLDFCGTLGTELYAAGSGQVTYTGSLTVRGGVVVIDHGWGVYTAYDHLSEILVESGDTVTVGQLIGLGGATGRTTGPHLHWEVWAGGVQVDPADWLVRAYP